MPIRLNLLAENQALEEARRRDPVKRAIFAAAVLVVLVLVWSSSLQLSAMVAKGALNRLQSQLASKTNAYRAVIESRQKLADSLGKLAALQELATNRFLQGSLLNALQQTTLDDVRLTRLHSESIYLPVDQGPKKPPKALERTVLVLDAKDSSATPGDQINSFKQVIADSPYFQHLLGKTNVIRLINLGTQQTGPDGKPFVLFTLECRLPEKLR